MRDLRVSTVVSICLVTFLPLLPRQAAALPGFVQEASLTASDAAVGDHFGGAVDLSLDGTVALVGASGDDCAAGTDCGAAYVYVKAGSVWSQQAKLTASMPAAGGVFGYSVSLSGDGSTALVKARSNDCLDSPDCAVAYVFRRSGGAWIEEARLRTSGPFYDLLVRSMKLTSDGSRAFVGAPAAPVAGVVHIFTRNVGGWTEETRLREPATSYFGNALDLSEDGLTLLVSGEAGPDLPSGEVGGPYVFVRNGGEWRRQQQLTASLTTFQQVGALGEVALSGDGNTALVSFPSDGCGHLMENPEADGYCGALRAYTRVGGTWTERQYLNAPGYFGNWGNRLALSRDGKVALVQGRGATLLERASGTWIERQRQLPGAAVALSADGFTALLGAPFLGQCSSSQNACGIASIFLAGSAVTIPAASDFGLILLALLLAASGAAVLFKRRRNSAVVGYCDAESSRLRRSPRP